MSQCNNTPCNCNESTNPCGCQTSTDSIVYSGPTLPCTGVENCTPLTEALEQMDSYICGPDLINTIIFQISNNPILLETFVTLVNNSLDCQTVWDCITTSSTTTAIPIIIGARMIPVFADPKTGFKNSFFTIEKGWIESDYSYRLNSFIYNGVEVLSTYYYLDIANPADLVVGPGQYGGTYIQNFNDWLNSIPEVSATGIVFYDDMSIIDIANINDTFSIEIEGSTNSNGIYNYFKNSLFAGATPFGDGISYGLNWLVFPL